MKLHEKQNDTYSPWCSPDSLKSRFGFVMKSNDDCFWTNTGKRLCASTERAVLALIEAEEDTSIHEQQKGDTLGTSPTTKPKGEISEIRKIIYSRIENIQEP